MTSSMLSSTTSMRNALRLMVTLLCTLGIGQVLAAPRIVEAQRPVVAGQIARSIPPIPIPRSAAENASPAMPAAPDPLDVVAESLLSLTAASVSADHGIARSLDGQTSDRRTAGRNAGANSLDRVAAPLALPPGTWTRHACADCYISVAAGPDAIWAGTYRGGIVRWSTDGRSFKRWTKADGLPDEMVTAIAPAPDGIVWAVIDGRRPTVRDESLVRFDGTAWTEVAMPSWLVGSIAPYYTGRAAAADDAGVWIASSAGLGHFDGVRWTRATAADGSLPSDDVHGVVFAPDGTLWVSTENGLANRAPDGTWRSIASRDGAPYQTNALHVTPDGDVWAAIWNGVMHFEGRSWTNYSTVDGLRHEQVTSITSGTDGRVWVAHNVSDGGGDDSMSVWNGTSWAGVGTADGLPSSVIGRLATGPGGAVWATTVDDGLGRLGAAGWETVMNGDGPPKVITFDVSTSPLGMARFAHFDMGEWPSTRYVSSYDGEWHDFTMADGLARIWNTLPGGVGADGAIDAVGGYWWPVNVDSDTPGLLRFDGRTTTVFSGAEHPPGGPIHDLLFSPKTNAIFAVNDAGVHYRKDDAWTSIDVTKLPSADLSAVGSQDGIHLAACWIGRLPDSADVVPDGCGDPVGAWVGGRDFVARHVFNDTWTVHAAGGASGFPSGTVQDIDEAGTSLWVLMEDSTVARLRDDTWTSWSPSTVLGGTPLTDGRFANGLAADDRGGVWVGVSGDASEGVGASYFDGRTWNPVRMSDGLVDNVIFDIEVESTGRVWFAGLTAIGTFDPEPHSPTVGPTTPCVCDLARVALPPAVIDAAVANPERVFGWLKPRDPGKPVSPFNPLRTCLTLSNPATPYHPLHNRPIFSAGCP